MDNLIQLGFNARKICNEDLELHYFNIWCKENELASDDTFKAELIWEMNLSKLKMKNIYNLESKLLQVC